MEGKVKVQFPFGEGVFIPRDQVRLDKLPDFELRVRDVATDEIKSEFFTGRTTVKSEDMRGLDMKEVEALFMQWLKKRYGSDDRETILLQGKGFLPADYGSWTKMAAGIMTPYFFAERMKHLRTPRSAFSMIETNFHEVGQANAGPRLRLWLAKNLRLDSTYYHEQYNPQTSFADVYDSRLHFGGGVGGWVDVFGVRQIFVVYHRFIQLANAFPREELRVWIEHRINALLPGIVDKGLVTNFEWLPQGKYFGGDTPTDPTMGAVQRGTMTREEVNAEVAARQVKA